MTFQLAMRAALLAVATAAPALAASVTPLVNLGGYVPDEMTIDRATGDIYLTAFSNGSPTLAIVRVTSVSLTTSTRAFRPRPGKSAVHEWLHRR